ncbi:PP2 domain-containing protein, partial [Acinetobacter baumannii]
MLSARELSITWATNSLCWCWKTLLDSRFPESVELIMVCWLDIRGKINSRMLSPNTTYAAYLVVRIEKRAFGLDALPSEFSVEVGDYKTRGTIYLKRHECKREGLNDSHKEEEYVVCERGNGWLEIKLGEFYNDGSEKEVNMLFRENSGEHLKGGLVVEGIELRPKE